MEKVLTDKKPVYNELEKIKVADINFGLTNAAQIAAMRKRGLVARKLDIASQKIAKFKLLEGKVSQVTFDTRIDKMIAAVRALDKQLEEHDVWLDDWEKENTGKSLRAVTAYITFEEEEGYLRCLREYPDLGALHRLFQPYKNRFLKKRMKIIPAPDPTDIIWENLDYGYFARAFRKLCVNFVTFLLLLISFALILVTKLQKAQVEREIGRPSFCPEGITKEDVVRDENFGFYEEPYKVYVECYCRSSLNTK